MGAYSNPQMLIDTQTGEYYRGLQSSIASSFSNYAQSYAVKQQALKKQLEENKKRIDEINNQTEEYAFALRSGIGKLKTEDSKINVAETFEPLIQEAVKLKSGLLNNTITGSERQVAMQKLADINSTIAGDFSTSLSDLSSFAGTLDAALLKPVGSIGGLAIDMPADDVKALRIMQGKLGGIKKAVYKDSNPNNLVWEIYDESGSLVKEYAAVKLKEIGNLGNEYVKLVPDLTKNNEMLKANNGNVFETKAVNPKDPNSKVQATGRLKDEFLEKDADGQIKTEKRYVGTEGSGTYKLVANPDYKKIEAVLAAQVDAQIAGLTDEELVLHTNNTVNSYREKAGLKPIFFDSNGILDAVEKEQAVAAYKEHFMATQIPSGQDIIKEDSDVLLFKDPKAEKPTKGAGNKPAKEPKKTQTQILNETVFETLPADRASKGVGLGTIVRGPNKKYKIADKNDGGRTGYWYELDKDGFIVGNPVSEKVVRAQIGYKKTK